MTSRTGKRVRRSRAARGLAALTLAGALAVGASACTSTVSGEATPTGVGASAGTVITAAGIESVACKPSGLPFDATCHTASITSRDLASGSTLAIKAGDPIRLTQGGGDDRVCAVGAFLRDTAGAVWAVTGAECAVSTGGAASTTDGYTVGTVEKVARTSTSADSFIPLVKLRPAVKGAQSARTIAAPTPNTAVTIATPHGSKQWAGISASALIWRGPGAAPTMVAGDAGSPITQGSVLVGLSEQTNNATDFGQVQQVLAALGSGAQLAV